MNDLEDQNKSADPVTAWLVRWEERKETIPDPDFMNMLEELENK